LAPFGSRIQTTAAGRRSLHVRLDEALLRGIQAFAAEGGLGLSSAVRLLTARALRETQPGSHAASRDEAAASLAALVAAEHSLLMVASVLPEGERRMHELASQAALAAEERLALFREPRL
jgi:antitoxin component of RelBE/YafQ-DinJ toxin-antitoxin module